MPHIKQMLLIGAAAACLSACEVEEAEEVSDETVAATEAPSPTPSPSPSPSPEHTPTPDAPSTPTIGEMEPVNSGLDINEYLRDVPIASGGQDVGAFRFLCSPSHLSYDDPIVFPGQPGAAHLHLFFGNTEANGNSTYESLRTTGDSTCANLLNRSAYWMPALLDGQGSALMPNFLTIYYKRRPSSDSLYAETSTFPTQIPRGLRFVFGSPRPNSVDFTCMHSDRPETKSSSMTEVLNACSVGEHFYANIISPSCWDGQNLDSTDHRSHMEYELHHSGTGECPASHPYAIARFTIRAAWVIESGDMPALWRFSSDMDGAEPGSTLHADWYGAWEDSILETWHDHCIDRLLSCNDADLGNGRQLIRNSYYPNGSPPDPRSIPISTIK